MKNKKVRLMQGNEACVEGALAAGMRFYGGYPITPSTEIAEISAEKLPCVGGKFIQMEDEIGGIAAAIGASLAGLKSMTATSGPGFSLKQENLGYATVSEIPLVIVNVQRGGPSTGLPTAPAQADIMQAKWGTHGDHPIIALSPSSVRETFDVTIRAFNLAEKYRTPVIILTDEVVGHMRERIEIPDPSEIEVIDRVKPDDNDDNYLPYKVSGDKLVPPMAAFGDGHRYHVTGLIHDETGFPSTGPKNAEKLLNRLMNKVNKNLDDIVQYEEFMLEDAEIAILSYGSIARSAKSAVKKLREEGIKAGLFRPITIWPFPEEQVKKLGEKVKSIIVAEMNLGQIVLEVERTVKGNCEINHIGKANGEVITPEEIVSKAKEVL
ncbi:2-oxoacid:acceptor oxidoreductase subunit alpha [Maledivibacter halophilus]|uniref:2-oxoglutarate ferredoxin oxidoreductase, alpha subunit n=1 Tax=Maledivibacter halophilus TaxID=36842 RepID=A0A1T5LA73_9FIRM|nr:2-oxoacid:acceptor oxidoreductase subunit alpha [Maledivibacter halophilus]SKC72881.1 2-oxoglutarate ferredoxin oxidoreductase, alpha subunit [Maledivibacter halophilus]